jgi:hypothetical protein
MRFDDDTPLPDDFDFDFDSEPAESGSAAAVEVREAPAEPDTVQVDLAFGEPEDWEDLLGEVDEDELAETEATVIAPDDDEAETGEDEPLPDVDTQFATQAEAMGIDLSGVYAQAEESAEKAAEESAGESTIDDDLIAAAFEAEAKLAEEEPREESADTIIGIEEDADGDSDDEFSDLDLDVDELDDLIEARDKELVASTEEDAKLAAELGLDEELESEDDKPELVVPPLTEEEQTINMMIDQDLLAIAVEDEDGFASTIVQKQTSEQDQPSEDQGEEAAETKSHGDHADKDSPLVETIIMEGEFVRDAVEEERLEAERQKTAEAEQEKDSEADTGKSKRDERAEGKEPLDYRMVAGIAALALLLGAQFVHQSRESLAVYPAFNKSVGSVYRMLGKPVVPAWDVAGWRFEATKGSTDESDEMLTIYSRIGNKSGEALPYPLINVSLTDRFEDIIGSKVLEPGDYLAESLDTRQPVAPGETFSAVISIEAPDADATGFKLNVCYRQPGGRLRCAIDDFK